MKYLKKFQTNADYQSFKSSGDWITPNVSVIADDDTIVFEPFVGATSLITFTVDGVEYQAEEGMYWIEWCYSEYNVGGFICEGGDAGRAIYTSDYKKYLFHTIYAGDLVTAGQYVTKKVDWPLPWM